MAAKRPPCEYCEQGYGELVTVHSPNSDDLTAEIYPGVGIYVFAYSKDENGETCVDTLQIPMNYCPVCGRKWTM